MSGSWRAGACKRLIVSIPAAPPSPPPPAEDALPPLSPPRACAACRSIRLRRGSAVRSFPLPARCAVAAARRTRGGDGRVERACGGRLVEAVGMIDSKMTKDARGGRQRRAGRCCGYAHDEALTSTGSTRTRHRSASASRALCINPRNFQLCPETRRHAAVTRPFWCRPSHLTGGRQRLPSWALICAPLEVTRYERGVRRQEIATGASRWRFAPATWSCI